MATIAELQTKLTIDRSALTRGLSAATNEVKTFGSRFKAELLLAGTAVATLGLAFTKLKSIVSEAEGRISNLVDTSTRLGAGIPALQQLQYVAQQTGISTESLNNALSKMEVTLGSAMAGSAQAAHSFTQLGLSISELSKMDAAGQYIAISDAVKELSTAAEQNAGVRGIFGRAGPEQLSALKDNVRGLIDEYKSLGTMLSGDQARSVERYGDSVTKLGTVWTGFKNQLTVALAGPLTQFVEWVVEAVKNMGGMQAAATGIGNAIVRSMNLSFQAVRLVAQEFLDFEKNLRTLHLALANFRLKLTGTGLDEVLLTQEALAKAEHSRSGFLDKINLALNTQVKTLGDINKELDKENGLKSLGLEAQITDQLTLQESALEKTIKAEQRRFDNQKDITSEMKRQVDAAHNLYEEVRAAQSFERDLKKDLDSVEASIRQDREEERQGLRNAQGGQFHAGDRDTTLDKYAPRTDRMGRLLSEANDSQRTQQLKQDYNDKINDRIEQIKHSELLKSIDTIQFQQATNEKLSLQKLEDRLLEIRETLKNIAGEGGNISINPLRNDPQNPQRELPPQKVDVNISASEDFVTKIVTSNENVAMINREAANQIAKLAAAEQ